MAAWGILLLAGVIFLVGMRLSAFFNGAESGFYRVSFLRLSIDAHSGDRVARTLMWFVQNPAYFVSTSLVGNNIGHYVITLAIGLGADVLIGSESVLVEVATTLLFTPVIFAFAELMPKSLYLRAPTQLLRRDARWFKLCYQVFLPVTIPLVWLTRLLERLSNSETSQMEHVLGRHRLIQVLDKGQEHGLLTNEQGQLIHGLLHDANRRATEVMTPIDRVLGLDENASRAELLDFARAHGLTHVPIRRRGTGGEWFGYVRASDLVVSAKSVTGLIQPSPEIAFDATRLMALQALRESGHAIGAVFDNGKIVGLVAQRALLEQFMHPFGSKRSRHMRAPLAKSATTTSSS